MDILYYLPTFALLLHQHFSITIPANDTATLLLFHSETDIQSNLLPNWTLSQGLQDACTSKWRGVRCSTNKRVTALSLPSLSLRGPVSSLSSLAYLCLLDLSNNRLNGTLHALTSSSRLKLVYLSGNDFSGEVPTNISSLSRLIRSDLSNNNLRGPIPNSLSNLTPLLTLRLQNNEITGKVPKFFDGNTKLKELNLSNNGLFGRIHEDLVKQFGESSFLGNQGICGANPFPECSFFENVPSVGEISETVSSTPTSLPMIGSVGEIVKTEKKGSRPGAIVAIVVVSLVVLLGILSFIVAYCCGRYSGYSGSISSNGEIL